MATEIQRSLSWRVLGMSESEMRAKLDHIVDSIDDIKVALRVMQSDSTSMQVWRAECNARLAGGAKQFEEIRKSLAEQSAEHKKTLEEKIDKKTVWAYLLGAAGGAAGLMKLFGG